MKHAYILAMTKEQLHNLNVKQPKTALKTEKGKKKHRTSWFHRAARVEPMKKDCLEPLEESITPSSLSYIATDTLPTSKHLKPSQSNMKGKWRLWPSLGGIRGRRKVAPTCPAAQKASDLLEDNTRGVGKPSPHTIFCRPTQALESDEDLVSSQPMKDLISDPDVGAAQTGSEGNTGAESWSDPVEYLTKHPFFMSTSSTLSDEVHQTVDCVDVDDVSLSIGSVGSLLCSNQASIDNIALGINKPRASTDTLVGDLVLHSSAEESSAGPVIVEPMDMDLTEPALDGRARLHHIFRSLQTVFGTILWCGRVSP